MDAQKPKEPLLSLMLAFIIPGLGQFYSSKPRRGMLFFGINVLAVTGGLLYAMHPTLTVHPASMVLLIAFALFELFVLIDSYLCAKNFNRENNLERKISIGKRILFIFGILFFMFGPNLSTPLTVYVRSNIIQAFKIPSGAMRLTLIEGDRLFVDKSAYKNSAPQRGDIAVFVYPKDDTRDFIKRVIGLPGESLEIREGKILINGQKLSSSPIISNFYYDNKGPNAQPGMVIDIPDGHYFVLGDNSQSSSDSRFWGFVPEENFVGRAFKIYYPFNRSGPLR